MNVLALVVGAALAAWLLAWLIGVVERRLARGRTMRAMFPPMTQAPRVLVEDLDGSNAWRKRAAERMWKAAVCRYRDRRRWQS